MTVTQKIETLRKAMAENAIDAFIVYSADPHLSEYLPEEWQERTWLTGFTGSAGFVVITQEKAALWTDGRYFVQAEDELKGTGITLMKMGEPMVPTYENWLLEELSTESTVAVDAKTSAHSIYKQLEEKLATKDIRLTSLPLLQKIWTNRATTDEEHPVFIQSIEWAGVSAKEKISNIRKKMTENHADTHIISALDDVAWTLNLRGKDVAYNPVFLGYILLTENENILFIDPKKVDSVTENYLKENSIIIRNYDDFYATISSLSEKRILLSPNSNQEIFNCVKENNTLIPMATPGNLMKAQKNEQELEGFRIAMQKDGVAMVKFLHWLDTNVGKTAITEYSIGEKLREFRAEQPNFVGESFGSIVGYRDNGAVIHYSAKPEGSNAIEKDGSLLIDSGGQYLEGTTDITRTVVLGEVTDEFKKNWTLVLKGMIQLSMAKFPKGTKGLHLDAIARLPLWKDQKDYNHGTGHGVGSFLNVHEGPQNIRKDINLQDLLPGMVCSNEPGYYVEKEYGIRLENLIAVEEISDKFMHFETLTICPFDTRALDKSLLNQEERVWLNNYHRWCKDKLENDIPEEIKDWFNDYVQPI